MAIAVSSITTRYGDTYTESDNNSSVFVGDVVDSTDITVSAGGDVITVAANQEAVITDSSTGDSFEWILFDRTIILEDGARLHGSGQQGRHAWFVNCTFIIRGDATDGAQTFGPADDEGSAIGGRTDTITGTKSGDSTWNYYGCSFVFANETAGERSGAIVFGDMVGCDITTLATSGGSSPQFYNMPIIQTMNNSVVDGLVINSQNRLDVPVSLFMFSTPARTDGLVLNNSTPYIGNSQEISFVEYEQIATADFDVGGTNSRPTCLVHTTTAANMINPRTQFDATNSIIWRHQQNSRNGVTGGVLIQRQRIAQRYFSDPGLIEGRKDVKYSIDSNATWTDTAQMLTINQSSATQTNYLFTSGTDGILEGTVDINYAGATVANQDFEEIDLPVQVLSSTTNVSGNQYGNDKFDFNNDVNVMSLWGTTIQTVDKDGGTIVLTAADDDGYWIAPDEANNLDPDDELMAGLSENINNIGANLEAASGSISLTDIGQAWKHFAWDTRRFGIWSTDHYSGGVLDVTGSDDLTGVELTPGQATIAAEGTDAVSFDAPVTSNVVTISVGEDDVVQKIRAVKIDCTTSDQIQLDGGTYEAAISGLNAYPAVPSGSAYTVRNATLNGSLDFTIGSGATAYIVLENVEIETGGTLTINNNGSGKLEVIVRGDVPALTVGTGDVAISIEKVITLQLDGEDFDSTKLTARFATSSSSSVGTFFNQDDAKVSTVANDTEDKVDIVLRVDNDQSNLWYAIAYDGYDVVAETNSLDSTFTHELTKTTVSEINFGINVFTVGDLDLTTTTVAAITSATAGITATIADTDGGSITNALTRIWIRKYIVEADNFMDAMAQGFVATDYFSFDSGFITLPNSETEQQRLTIQHASSTGIYQSSSRLTSRDLTNDLYDQVTTSSTDTYFTFGVNASGASVAEIQAIISTQNSDLMGSDNKSISDAITDIQGTDSRTITEAYREAKRAKNAAFS